MSAESRVKWTSRVPGPCAACHSHPEKVPGLPVPFLPRNGGHTAHTLARLVPQESDMSAGRKVVFSLFSFSHSFLETGPVPPCLRYTYCF